MSKLDPQLQYLVESEAVDLREAPTLERFGMMTESMSDAVAAAGPSPPREAIVLVESSSARAALEAVGLKIRSIAGKIATGVIPLDRIAALSAVPGCERVEAARQMHSELDISLIETHANLVHVGPPGLRGSGVIVGIVDSGIDYTHPSFRRSDGTSRILFIWDQGMMPQNGEANPEGLDYGVEYNRTQIDAALRTADPFALVRHRDGDSERHGTHVAGIAAGDGSAPGSGKPPFSFVGVAPEADIIVVASSSDGSEGIGTSANTLDAVNYVYGKAAMLRKPAVINMSLGDNLGPHDGTSLLERGLAQLLGDPGRAFVKSAGNAAASEIHASGSVTAGQTVEVAFNEPVGNRTPDQIDLWYGGADRFRISVVDSAGNATGAVDVGAAQTFTFPSGNSIRIDHRDNDSQNGDKRIFLTLTRGSASEIRPGNWLLRLVGVAAPSGGRFHAWIQRGPSIPRFLAPHLAKACTISTPGTANEVITAASYITRGTGLASLSTFSSRGPTRDGRPAPTIAAPGQAIISASGHFGNGDPYQPMNGTSMAAPHVTGAIALMFQVNPNLTQEQIITCLQNGARRDTHTGAVPNNDWGAGKIDIAAAVGLVPAAADVEAMAMAEPKRRPRRAGRRKVARPAGRKRRAAARKRG